MSQVINLRSRRLNNNGLNVYHYDLMWNNLSQLFYKQDMWSLAHSFMFFL